jgi:hypothetical protein
MNRLCLFACKYGHCPQDVCANLPADDDLTSDDESHLGYDGARAQNNRKYTVYQDHSKWDKSVQECLATCKPQLDGAAAANRTSNYGCTGIWPVDEPIPWMKEVS